MELLKIAAISFPVGVITGAIGVLMHRTLVSRIGREAKRGVVISAAVAKDCLAEDASSLQHHTSVKSDAKTAADSAKPTRVPADWVNSITAEIERKLASAEIQLIHPGFEHYRLPTSPAKPDKALRAAPDRTKSSSIPVDWDVTLAALDMEVKKAKLEIMRSSLSELPGIGTACQANRALLLAKSNLLALEIERYECAQGSST